MVAHTGGYYGEALRGIRGVTQGEPFSPTISPLFWIQWWSTGYLWWREEQEVHTGGGGGFFTARTSSTRMTSWSRPLTLSGFRGCSTPSPGCSTGWGSGIMSVRQSGCSDAPSAWLEPIWRRYTCNRWWERESPTGTSSNCGYSDWTMEWTWRRGCLQTTSRHITELVLDPIGIPPPRENRICIRFNFQARQGRGTDWSRCVRGGWRQGQDSACTSCNGTCGTPW